MVEQFTNNSSVSVTNTASVVLNRRSGARKSVLLRNLDAALTITLYFSNNEVATANKGIVLLPYEYWQDEQKGDYTECYQGTVTAIASAAGPATLAVFERCDF